VRAGVVWARRRGLVVQVCSRLVVICPECKTVVASQDAVEDIGADTMIAVASHLAGGFEPGAPLCGLKTVHA